MQTIYTHMIHNVHTSVHCICVYPISMHPSLIILLCINKFKPSCVLTRMDDYIYLHARMYVHRLSLMSKFVYICVCVCARARACVSMCRKFVCILRPCVHARARARACVCGLMPSGTGFIHEASHLPAYTYMQQMHAQAHTCIQRRFIHTCTCFQQMCILAYTYSFLISHVHSYEHTVVHAFVRACMYLYGYMCALVVARMCVRMHGRITATCDEPECRGGNNACVCVCSYTICLFAYVHTHMYSCMHKPIFTHMFT
jgi:hypothetical protein